MTEKHSPLTPGKVLWRIVQAIAIVAILFFLIRKIVVHWEQVTSYTWQIQPVWLGLSVLSVIITFYLFSSVWRMIIISLGKQVSFAKAFKIAYLANLGRYIPGKIWQMFGMIYLARKEGITEEEAVTSFGLSQIFAIPSGLLSGLLFLAMRRGGLTQQIGLGSFSTGLMLVAAGIFVISLLVIFAPRSMQSVLNRVLRLLRRREVSLQVNKSLAAAIYGGYFLAWSLYGFSFWVFLKGITVAQTPLLPITGLFIVAYQIGYLMLFAPGGVGPREAMMTIFLTPWFGQAVAAAVALAARLWLICAETLSALIALRIK